MLGFGNPVRRDDAVGIHVAERLAASLGDAVIVLTAQQPLPEWAPALAEVDVAYMIDADPAATRLRLRRLEMATVDSALGAHSLAPAHLLALTLAVFGRAPQTYLLSLPASDFLYGETLSPRTAAYADMAVRLVERRLRAP